MTIAHDIFSEFNPAFCACVLVKFTAAFTTVNEKGPELPVAYISLPVALSGDLNDTFSGTNKNTGLLEWFERNPSIQVGLPERLNYSMEIVSEAIKFGCFSKILKLDEHAKLLPGDNKIKKKAFNALSEGPIQSLKYAERLGYWFAKAGSTKTIFDIMGLTL